MYTKYSSFPVLINAKTAPNAMKYLPLFTLMLLSWNPTISQERYKVNNKLSEIKIEGTSSLHDWYALAETIQGKAEMSLSNKTLEKLHELWLSIPVYSIKGEKNGMNKDIYEALKAKEYAKINLKLTESRIEDTSVFYTIQLSIAGNSKIVNGKSNITLIKNGMNAQGDFKIKLTDFGITPPKAVFGTLKVGDEIHLSYSIVFEKE